MKFLDQLQLFFEANLNYMLLAAMFAIFAHGIYSKFKSNKNNSMRIILVIILLNFSCSTKEQVKIKHVKEEEIQAEKTHPLDPDFIYLYDEDMTTKSEMDSLNIDKFKLKN
jgi:hypothetical protein